MATNGSLNGTDLLVYVDGSAIAGTTSHSLSQSMETREGTTKDSGGWQEALEGLRSWSVDFEGLVAFDAAYGYEELFDLIDNRTKVTLVWSSKISGDVQFTGAAYLTDLSKEAGNEETVTMSGTLTGTGSLVKSNVT